MYEDQDPFNADTIREAAQRKLAEQEAKRKKDELDLNPWDMIQNAVQGGTTGAAIGGLPGAVIGALGGVGLGAVAGKENMSKLGKVAGAIGPAAKALSQAK